MHANRLRFFALVLGLLFGASLFAINSSRKEPSPNNNSKRLIFVITPTHWRPEQFADLTRLGQTLALDGGIHWIVIEDSNQTSTRIAALLKRLEQWLEGTTHLHTETPEGEKLREGEFPIRPRGHRQRNSALAWLRKNHRFTTAEKQAVVYFADDDNTYDIRLFDKMRALKRVGVWPVGLIGHSLYEAPICDRNHSNVVGWRTVVKPERFCPCDMAGFAVSLSSILKQKNVYFPSDQIAMLESGFLAELFDSFTSLDSSRGHAIFEPFSCDEILVWHTQTKSTPLEKESLLRELIPTHNLVV